MDTPDVSVIVVNFNGREWLGPCLEAIAAQNLTPLEVIVVDNASTDGSVAFVRERFPSVQLVAVERNSGFAGGNNAGARIARGRHLAFLNNDTVADPGWLSALQRALDGNASAGAATSRIVYMNDPAVIDSAGDGYTCAGGAFKRGHGGPAADYRVAEEVFGACGAAFMIRREVFEELGGFDDDFFLVYEDVDLSYRAQLLGHHCLYVPEAIVLHAGSATMGTLSSQAVFHGQRNLEWVYLKNTPLPLLLRTMPSHLAYVAAAAVFFAFSGRFWAFLRGKGAALLGVPKLLAKRRAVQRSRRSSTSRLRGLMEPHWFALKWREKSYHR